MTHLPRLFPQANRPLAASLLLAASTLPGTLPAHAQAQSLSFSGGVLLGPRIRFHHVGGLPPSPAAGPATGSAADRTYDDGFVRVDSTGNDGGTTAYWGHSRDAQVDPAANQLVLTAPGGAPSLNIPDAADFAHPSGNLEYRGSLGALGESDWGMLLSIGYQSLSANAHGTFTTPASVLEDRFDLGALTPADIPAAPYAGTADTAAPRIGASPTRTHRDLPGGRSLSGNWEFEGDLVPIAGGLYLESQLAGRLNAIASAGVFVAFVNANLRFTEVSTSAGSPPVTTVGSEGGNDVIYGGFVQLGLDWAPWENASLVVAGRWQPASDYNHSVDGREAAVDFTTAVAIHVGFSLRF